MLAVVRPAAGARSFAARALRPQPGPSSVSFRHAAASTSAPRRAASAALVGPPARPVHARSPVLTPARLYSTGGPNQHQVLQGFGTPFSQFVHTISRVARIISLSALTLGLVGLGAYELTHQYVEHVSMRPAGAPTSLELPHDPWGWVEQLQEESWSGSPSGGTDSRLGIKGRHAVRSAWICTHWGGGISPDLLLGGAASGSSGLGRTAQSSIAGANTLHIVDGLLLALQYMDLALKVARSKGIALPDIDAFRAGLTSASAADRAALSKQFSQLDPTALALELKLASIKERQGSRSAMVSAIETYERVFDLLSHPAAAAADASRDNGERSPTRLVRLANKIGDLNASLGNRSEAEGWLHRALALAGESGAGALTSASSSFEAGDSTVSALNAAQASPAPSGWFDGWLSKGSTAGVARHAAGTSVASASASPAVAPTAAAPTPALTRSLLSTLISLSALYAQRPASGLDSDWHASLTQALQLQTHALKLAQLESDRLAAAAASASPSPSPPRTSAPQHLHALTVRYLRSVLDLHLAETVYALETRFPRHAAKRPSSAAGQPARFAHSLTWLDQARVEAHAVVQELAPASREPGAAKRAEGKGRGRDAPRLAKRWEREAGLETFAGRVARDAGRVEETAERLRRVLVEAQGGAA